MIKKLNKNIKIGQKRLIKSNKIICTLCNFLYLNQFATHKRYLLHTQQLYNTRFNVTKIRHNCILTGRSRSIYRFFNLSRLKLKEYGQAGYFAGFSKISW